MSHEQGFPPSQDPRGKDTTLGKADLLEPLHAGLQTLGSAYDHVSCHNCKSEASTVCEQPCLCVYFPLSALAFLGCKLETIMEPVVHEIQPNA